MARTKKADSAINSFFTDTSKEMVERQLRKRRRRLRVRRTA